MDKEPPEPSSFYQDYPQVSPQQFKFFWYFSFCSFFLISPLLLDYYWPEKIVDNHIFNLETAKVTYVDQAYYIEVEDGALWISPKSVGGSKLYPYAKIRVHKSGLFGVVRDVDIYDQIYEKVIWEGPVLEQLNPIKFYNVNNLYYYQPFFLIIAVLSLTYLIIPNLYFRYFSVWLNLLISFWTLYILILYYFA